MVEGVDCRLSLESHLDVVGLRIKEIGQTASEKRSSQYDSPVEKRVDVEENDDEFWKRVLCLFPHSTSVKTTTQSGYHLFVQKQ